MIERTAASYLRFGDRTVTRRHLEAMQRDMDALAAPAAAATTAADGGTRSRPSPIADLARARAWVDGRELPDLREPRRR